MFTSPLSGRRSASAPRQILAVAAAAFLIIQSIAFIFPTFVPTAYANNTAQTPPFTQNWTNTGLITANDNWTGVPGIEGFFLNSSNSTTGIDPQTVLTDTFNGGTTTVDLDVIANQTNPNTNNTGGVAEFESTQQAAPANANPAIALNGSATADAPFILLYLNTTGQSNINVAYNLRDLDCTIDNATQPVALQFRVGNTGSYTNVPAGFVADATAQTNGTATDTANCTLVTPVSATLPAAANNQSLVQVRILSTNAVGNDEWVGIDDINVTSGAAPAPTLNINDVTMAEGNAGTTPFTFTVSLTSAAAGNVTFNIATADGTAQDDVPATEDNDYVANSETGKTITAGNTSTTFTVFVNGDTVAEPNETFFVNLTNIAGAATGDSQGLGTITNDEVVITPIHTIQGSGTTSPFATQVVTTTGIVTGVKSNGFFIQEPDATVDSDPNTSEGVQVFTSSAPPAAAAIGNRVNVTGTVVEFIPSADPNSPPLTEISSPTSISLMSTGNPLPAPIEITGAETTGPSETTKPLDTLEEYEGMRVSVASLTVVAPTQGTITESSATATSNGVFYGVVTGVARPFREPGIAISDPVPAPSPANVPRFDENPERLRVDSDGQTGTTAINVTSGTVLTGVVGVVDFGFRTYTILPDAATPPGVGTVSTFTPVPAQTANELTVGSFNMQRFYDTTDDPGTSDVVLTATAFNNRLNKASLAIRNAMRSPDVIGIVEMENLSTLQAVATKVNNDAVAGGDPNPGYTAYLEEGNDIGGIDVGFLVKSRVSVVSVTQFGKADTTINPNTGVAETLNDRPPLVLLATIARPSGGTFAFTVIVNHLRSLNDVDNDTTPNGTGTAGSRVRAKRRAQAEYLANLIQMRQSNDPTEKIISVGDYNAFQFNDGYVDSIGTIKGTPAPPDQVVLPSSDLVNPDLTNLIDTVMPEQRYSYSFDGNAQSLDHILVNDDALTVLTRFAYARNNADFPQVYFGDSTRPERVSDHDMPVAYLTLGAAVTQPGAVLISEFRFNGPGGNNDEFIELYNNTGAPVDVNGWTIASPSGMGGGGVVITSPGLIPARGHYLVAPGTFTANGYPAGVSTTATPEQTYTGAAFLDDGGARLVDLNGAIIDAVGFSSASATGYREGAGLSPATGLAPSASDQYSFVRRLASGLPQDTNDNAADFVLVSTTGTVGATTAMLGAPGPENTQSPIQSNAIVKASLIDNCSTIGTSAPGTCQNRVRDGSAGASNPTNAQRGTLSFRRRFTNASPNMNVVRLRFRVVDITTLNTPGYAPNNGQADLRLLTSTDTTVTPSNPFAPGDVQVEGTTLEVPPTQTLGGGHNSTVTLDLPAPLPSGQSVTVQFVVGVQQNGSYRFFVNTEAIFAPPIISTGTKTPTGRKAGSNR